MKIQINLASQPFRRDRPVLLASALLGLVLVCTLGVLISLAIAERAQSADTRAAIARLDGRLKTVAAEQNKLDAVLRRPENAEVLERTLFLNTLLYRKGISWTKIFADLEKTVPHNVRILTIRPFVSGQGQLTLEMNVGAESPQPVIELVKALESSSLFAGAYVHSTLPPTQTEPLYRYRVTVNYAQKL